MTGTNIAVSDDLYTEISKIAQLKRQPLQEVSETLLRTALSVTDDFRDVQTLTGTHTPPYEVIMGPALKNSLNAICSMVRPGVLLGISPFYANPSITVSGIVAIGLDAVGLHEVADLLVSNITACLVQEGADRGTFHVPDLTQGYRVGHNWGNFWGLYSILLVRPKSADTSTVRDSVRYFLDHQQAGAWALSDSHKPKPYYTGHILLALMKFHQLSKTDARLLSDTKKAVEAGIAYLHRTRLREGFLWSEGASTSDKSPHLPTTLIALHALAEYDRRFGKGVRSRTEFEVALHSYIKPRINDLLQLNDAAKWPKVQENAAPTFHTWLSVPSTVSSLLACGVSSWDITIIRALKWSESHVVREKGVLGIEAGPTDPGTIANWSTGQALIAFGTWQKALSESVTHHELLTQLLKEEETVSTLNSAMYVERLRSLETSSTRWRTLATVAMLVSGTIGSFILASSLAYNAGTINKSLAVFASFLQNLAANQALNFAFGFLGVLPLIYTGIRWISHRLSKAGHQPTA